MPPLPAAPRRMRMACVVGTSPPPQGSPLLRRVFELSQESLMPPVSGTTKDENGLRCGDLPTPQDSPLLRRVFELSQESLMPPVSGTTKDENGARRGDISLPNLLDSRLRGNDTLRAFPTTRDRPYSSSNWSCLLSDTPQCMRMHSGTAVG